MRETVVRKPRPRVTNTVALASRENRATAAETPSQQAERQEKQVGVQGIEGTLQNFDVRVTMDKHAKAFARCHELRVRKVPHLTGTIEFKIHVLTSGEVAQVRVHASDLGDRVLERCMVKVIEDAQFPEPHGGEADVSWSMTLGTGRSRAEQWETARVERVLRKRKKEVLATCDARRAGPFDVTAYVAPSGRVLAVGVATKGRASSAEQFDCIANELRSWTMPRPRRGVAKVSFALRS